MSVLWGRRSPCARRPIWRPCVARVAATEEGLPSPLLATALFSRVGSRDLDQFANQVLSAMRNQFGGHVEKPDR